MLVSRRISGIVAAAALAGSGLATATVSASNAAGPTFTYNCSLSGSPIGSVTASFGGLALPGSVPSGSTLPAGPVTATVTIPGQLTTLLAVVNPSGTLAGDITGDLGMGSQGLPFTLTVPSTKFAAGQDLVANLKGSTSPTKITQGAGSVPLTLPKVISANLISGQDPATCTLEGAAPTIGSLNVTKAAPKVNAAITAKAAKKATVKKAKVTATVKAAGKAATGTVTAKKGSKTLATAKLNAGKAVLVLKKLKPGKNKIVVSYSGNATTKPATKTVVVKVKR